jgi:hypothetical protein
MRQSASCTSDVHKRFAASTSKPGIHILISELGVSPAQVDGMKIDGEGDGASVAPPTTSASPATPAPTTPHTPAPAGQATTPQLPSRLTVTLILQKPQDLPAHAAFSTPETTLAILWRVGHDTITYVFMSVGPS